MKPTARRPSALSTRITLTVLASFLAVFAVLLAVLAGRALTHGSGDLDRAAMDLARSFANSVNEVDDEVAARAIVVSQDMLQSGAEHHADDPPLHLYVIRGGGSMQATRGAPAMDPAAVAEGMGSVSVDGLAYRSYSARQGDWRVVVLDAAQARQQWVVRTLMADLALYMALALPVILVPVWLSVRTGLAPLRRLSSLVRARHPDDMRPLPAGRSYSELEPLEHALNAQFRRAAERIRREQAFVHDAAHELRTPLAVIATQAHLVGSGVGAARDEAKDRLQQAVERASHLVQQLLRLARADAASGVAAEPIDLMDLARDVLSMLADRAKAQNTELSLDGPEQAPMRGDAQLMRTIVANLVDNALRYGGPGGSVEVSLGADGGQWVLAVADRGPGVMEEDRQKAFERFWRHASSTSPGSGLGLAIVRQVAQSLGGTARLEGRDGGGCIAIVQWPLAPTPAP